jgi:signal transduction histidine kinase
MTIKRRLFISNILMSAVPIAMWIILMSLFGIFLYLSGSPFSAQGRWQDFQGRDSLFNLIWIFTILLLGGVVFLVSRLLARRMVKSIVTPLETLTFGVRQICNNNLNFRLDYRSDDEFLPVCKAFNEMALRLETMVAGRQKDEESRRELIAGISHDLRTPLTSIKAYLEGIETGVASTPEQRKKYIATIKNKTEDLEHIINRLFLFSKLDVNDFPFNLKTVDIGSLLSEITADISDEYAKQGLTIEFTGITQGVYVNLDPVLFHTVIVNILENSVKYKDSETGRLCIVCRIAGDTVEIRLTDDGPGVSKEYLKKLFDVFYRADPSRNTKGNGLGLAISKKIINGMGGTIHAEQGSIFEIPEGRGLSIVIGMPIVNGAGT